MTDIVITGATGYIGRRLCSVMAARGGPAIRILSRGDFEAWFCGETLAPAAIDFLQAADAIVHLAALPEPDCEKHPEQALRRNGLATLRLVEAAAAAKVRRFVYSSTIKVLGTALNGQVDETAPVEPPGHYPLSKYIGERYVLNAHRAGRLSAAVLRLSNVVGPPSAAAGPAVWQLIGNDFCRQALLKRQIVIKSSGLQWRNWLPMEDAVAAILHAVAVDGARLGDGLFHLGGATSCTILDFARQVAERATAMLRQPVTVETQSDQPAAAKAPLSLSIARLEATGFAARSSLQEAIDQTLSQIAQAGITS